MPMDAMCMAMILSVETADRTINANFNFVLTNVSQVDDHGYRGLELTANKRLSQRWQVLAEFTIQRQKGTFGRGYSA